MNKLLFITLCLVAFSTQNVEFLENKPLFEKYLPHENPLRHLSFEQIKSLLGFIPHNPWYNVPRGTPNGAPAEFDARTKWPKCIHPIRNQEHCGSCWAFGATEVLSDRYCIHGKDLIFSPQDLVSCDFTNHGCNGGNLLLAWVYLNLYGVATDSCVPYKSGDGSSHPCEKKCADSSEHYEKYHSTFATQPKSIEAIKLEIFNNGPVETGFMVYEDFMQYKSGIYSHSSGKLLGGHAVKIIGWGVENGIEYWIAANSWSEKWGEKGFFRIKFGECGFESQVIAGNPKN